MPAVAAAIREQRQRVESLDAVATGSELVGKNVVR